MLRALFWGPGGDLSDFQTWNTRTYEDATGDPGAGRTKTPKSCPPKMDKTWQNKSASNWETSQIEVYKLKEWIV